MHSSVITFPGSNCDRDMDVALKKFGFKNVNEVRQGKYFVIDTKETDKKVAEEQVNEMCKKLLANLVIEDFKIIESQ